MGKAKGNRTRLIKVTTGFIQLVIKFQFVEIKLRNA